MSDVVHVRSLANRTALPSEAVHAMTKLLPKRFYQRVHAPMPMTAADDIFPRAVEELAYAPQLFARQRATAAK